MFERLLKHCVFFTLFQVGEDLVHISNFYKIRCEGEFLTDDVQSTDCLGSPESLTQTLLANLIVFQVF